MSENRGDTPERRGPQTEPAKEGTGETGEQRITQTEPTKPSTSTPSEEGVVWVRFAPAQVVRTIVIALLSAAVVLGALFLLWQVRTIIGWAVLALFLAAVLNPAVNWLERHRIKRSIGIVLTYLGVVVGLLLIAGILEPGRGNRVPKVPLGAARARFPVQHAQRAAGRSAQPARRVGQDLAVVRRRTGCQRRHVRLCAGDHPDAHVLPALKPRGLYERRAQAHCRAAAAARAAPPGAVGRGDLRLHHRQPRHQLYLRRTHLHRAARLRYALPGGTGAAGGAARPDPAGRGDFGRGAAGGCGLLCQPVDGHNPAGLRPGLSAV